jgi:SAM-dependent methyltransferase
VPDHRLVSVIVNNFNYARFLREAIDSALAQTWSRLEVIVVDDGSTDDSREVLAGYGERVIPVLKGNGGQASAFNAGFTRCRGDVVLFLDADDALLPLAAESALALFDDPAVVNVHWPLWLMDERGRRTGEVLPRQPLAEGDLRDLVIRDGPDSYQGASTSGNAWSRSFLSRVLPASEPEYRHGADGYLITLAPLFGRMRTAAQPQGCYRVHGRNQFWGGATDERIGRSLLRYERRAATLEQHLAAAGVAADPAEWRRRNPYYRWMDDLCRATGELKAAVPEGATYLLADEGQWGPEAVSGRRAIPFPEMDGLYGGPPADDDAAIRELTRLHSRGPCCLVFGWPAFWWLDYYAGLNEHLSSRFPCVLRNERLIIFDLREARTLGAPPAPQASGPSCVFNGNEEEVRANVERPKSPAFPLYFPYRPDESWYLLPKVDAGALPVASRPVPPKETWISEKYGKTADEYLASGRRDTQDMLDVLERAGVSLEDQGHVLEFGCGDGRMIRCLEHLAAGREIWGVDVDAGRIVWCKQNLSPPFHFLTTTTVPHLPFEDRYFGFVYAGSVFTHIDDLADAWIAEIRRVLRPGGKLFMTVHLENDVALLNDKHRASGLARLLRSHPEYDRFVRSDFDTFTIGRSSDSYVFYDLDYLRKSLEPLFRILSVTSEVRLYQNALLLERS